MSTGAVGHRLSGQVRRRWRATSCARLKSVCARERAADRSPLRASVSFSDRLARLSFVWPIRVSACAGVGQQTLFRQHRDEPRQVAPLPSPMLPSCLAAIGGRTFAFWKRKTVRSYNCKYLHLFAASNVLFAFRRPVDFDKLIRKKGQKNGTASWLSDVVGQ